MPKRSIASRKIQALRVRQWLSRWNGFNFDETLKRRKPEATLYVFSMKAKDLLALSNVFRREKSGDPKEDGIQRAHDKKRSSEIAHYVSSGFPYSTLTDSKRNSKRFEDLRKPGWLPTAIVINILLPADQRRGIHIEKKDVMQVVNDTTGAHVVLPDSFGGPNWHPAKLAPIEIIDGQHRLYAFTSDKSLEDFEIPVVAFHGLDVSWQAYLFWTINIKPKKINASLAFDLYPLLRTEDWLDRSEDYGVYRETRAQELTEAVWGHPDSPWHHRIDMLGSYGRKYVSQAAWVHSLLATFIKRWEGKGVSLGGLFGGALGTGEDPLPWKRVQQAAFLILSWQLLARAVSAAKLPWTRAFLDKAFAGELNLDSPAESPTDLSPAFVRAGSLLNQDQGVRCVLHVLNDMSFVNASNMALSDWIFDEESESLTIAEVSTALAKLGKREKIVSFLRRLANELAQFDWRSFAGPGVTEDKKRYLQVYRGTGGYRTLRLDVVASLRRSGDKAIKAIADEVAQRLRKSQ